MDQLIQITTTSDDRGELERIAERLIENRLAGCCQIVGPMTSLYPWQGQMETSEEWTCSIKSCRRLFPRVCETIQQLHHYDVPQIVAVEIGCISEDYRDWLIDSLAD